MIRRPPRSTRTDTLFPYTTLFRSAVPIFGIAQHFHDVLVPKDGINRPSGIRVIRLRWNIEAGENIALHHRRFMPELREQGIGISHADPVIDIADRHEVVSHLVDVPLAHWTDRKSTRPNASH